MKVGELYRYFGSIYALRQDFLIGDQVLCLKRETTEPVALPGITLNEDYAPVVDKRIYLAVVFNTRTGKKRRIHNSIFHAFVKEEIYETS